ncbi:hypothetical protein BDN70DRAFT_563321 [Pholiota conissans]|uniref:Uncharacterized protein n=1 Tax=Pholiota conissans TaxID=109636 RepID=A0A9P5YLK8_9AGAR|nr:hypothetical protein BDN70DRAFT_563321 [Pholiota conissans]
MFLSDSTTVVQRSSPMSKLAGPDPSIRHDPRPHTSARAPQRVCYIHSSSPLPGPIHCTPTTNSPSYIHKSTVFLFIASNASTSGLNVNVNANTEIPFLRVHFQARDSLSILCLRTILALQCPTIQLRTTNSMSTLAFAPHLRSNQSHQINLRTSDR